MKTVTIDGKKYHAVGQDETLVECSSNEDCQLCTMEKRKEAERWVQYNAGLCALCDEKPPCYYCAKEKCAEWGANKQWIREWGNYHGCPHIKFNFYCGDYACKHGLLPYWHPVWLEQWKQKHKQIELKLLKERRKRKILEKKEEK